INVRRRSDSSGSGRNIMLTAAARGAHTAFSLVDSATKSNMRQRMSRRATTAKNEPATTSDARGSWAYGRPRSQDTRTGGDSKTSAAASNDEPVRSPSSLSDLDWISPRIGSYSSPRLSTGGGGAGVQTLPLVGARRWRALSRRG